MRRGAPRRLVRPPRADRLGQDRRASPRAWERLGPPVPVTLVSRLAWPRACQQPSTGCADHTYRAASADVLATGRRRARIGTTDGSPRRRAAGGATSTAIRSSSPRPARRSRLPDVRLELPSGQSPSRGATPSRSQRGRWTVSRRELVRLQQLLATAGYLPLGWAPAGGRDRNAAGREGRGDHPPAGRFEWRYARTPPELRRLWALGRAEHDHARRRDDVRARPRAGGRRPRRPAGVARADRRRDRRQEAHRRLQLRLRPSQRAAVTRPLAQRPASSSPRRATPVSPPPRPARHVPRLRAHPGRDDERHQSGRLPLPRPGIRWISYFNHGDAIHAFKRASFGTPQSLGCVELPLAAAAKVWPYTPIGTLVTIED